MNSVLFLMYNRTEEQLDLSKKALASVLAQDIGELEVRVINNGSTQPTRDWLDTQPFSGTGWQLTIQHFDQNISPVRVVNSYAAHVFESHKYFMSVPNDAVLPPNAYREMLRWPRGLVSIACGDNPDFPILSEAHAVDEHMPTVTGIVRKWVYDALVDKYGYFLDEGFFFYANDCDYVLRVAACGIHGVRLDLPFYHYGSAHWRMLPPEEGKKCTDQADRDREYLKKKWGVGVDDPAFWQKAADLNFRG